MFVEFWGYGISGYSKIGRQPKIQHKKKGHSAELTLFSIKFISRLRQSIQVLCQTAFQVGCFVFVDDIFLNHLVEHTECFAQ